MAADQGIPDTSDGSAPIKWPGLTALLDIAADAIIAIDGAHRIVAFNAGAEKIFGYLRAEVYGQPLGLLLPERFRMEHGRHIEALGVSRNTARRMGERQEILGLRKDGTEFPAEASIAMVVEHGERQYLALLRDVSERKRTERILADHARELELRVKERTSELWSEIKRREEAQAQLIQSQRMEAFGQLTGGVAHDFNNLLTIISGNLELLQPELSGDKSSDYAKRAMDAASMAGRLTSRLLTFARRGRLEPRIVDLNELILRMAEILRRTIGAPISLTTILSPEIGLARADPSEIENAILNLAINARDSMPMGGRLVIESRNAEFSNGDEKALSGLRRGRYVVVSVTDTGVGMTKEVADRAFEPFFTTKPAGRGTGLGLSTIFGFAQQSGGHLTLYSEPGKGTTVSLYLPREADGTVAAPQNSDYEVPLSEQNETILVVEDNPEVREVTLQRIEGLGYVVLEAANAREAVRILSGDDKIDLVFSDVIMPGGMSGFDLAAWILEQRPEIPVVLTSGFAGDAAQGQSETKMRLPLLNKPYSRLELAKMLKAALMRPHD